MEDDKLARLFMLSIETSNAALAGVLQLVNQLERRGSIDTTAKTEIAAAINPYLRAAEAVAGRPMPGLVAAREALDRWSADSD